MFGIESHVQYSPWVLLLASLVYTGLVVPIGALFASRMKIKSLLFWLAFGAVSATPLLILGGQHLPVVDSFAPSSFCFGEPGFEHMVSLLAPVAASIWLALAAQTETDTPNEGPAN